MFNKPKQIKDWGLDKKAQKIVERNIQLWLNLFIEQASGEQGNVYRADFIGNDFFYFTNCQNLMTQTPESKAIENDQSIRARKMKVLLQLFCKHLLGTFEPLKLQCSHCGSMNVRIDGLSNGHYRFCPNCGKVDFSTYLETIDSQAKEVKEKIHKVMDNAIY